MANKRNYEWPIASVFDGFFTQDKSGGVTERVSPALVVSAVQSAGVFQPLGADLTAIEALSTSGYLRRTGTNTWTLDSAATPASHAASHLFGGSDAIDGQSLTGLRISDGPRWGAVGIVAPSQNSDLDFRSSSATRRMTIRWNTTSDLLEFFSSNDDGSSRANRLLIPRTTATPITMLGGMNISSGALQIGGVEIVSSGRQAEFDKLTVKKALGATISTASRVEMLNNDASWGVATWMDSGANMRMAFLQNDATWTDRYAFGRNGNLNIISGSLQLGGVDTITSTREGRFTGLRLSNMSAGQIPVSSGANGQIAASGESDDGTYFTSNRIFRFWNTLTKSGNTWTAFQWNQNTEEKVALFSSDQGGLGGYATIALAPLDADLTGRNMGNINWVQRLSGKSGTNPGIKVAMSAQTVGSGGSVGGFGGKWRLEYRPDNGANMVDALRIGAFGGGTADAVETAILLRAKADFLANYAKIQKDADASVGLDVVGPSGTGKFRMLNSGGGSVLGINAGSLEISCANGIGIGTTAGNASILISTGDVSIAKTYLSGTHRVLPTERTSSASTAIDDRLVVYTGTTNHTESLPAATGSNRVLAFAHASSSGTWTIDANGTDEIAGELQAKVGSIAIFSNSSVKNRTLIDFAPGLWVVI